MLSINGPNENRVMTVIVSGELTREDYARLLPELEKILEKFESLRFFIRLRDFEGIEAGAVWEDLKFDVKHSDQYGRSAIVGSNRWEKWATQIANLFFSAEMKFFPEEDREQGWVWVNS